MGVEACGRRMRCSDPGMRNRYKYRCTNKGLALYPLLVALMNWGDGGAADPAGPAVALHHRDCGAPVRQVLECDAGHRVGGPREVAPRPGSGARRRTA